MVYNVTSTAVMSRESHHSKLTLGQLLFFSPHFEEQGLTYNFNSVCYLALFLSTWLPSAWLLSLRGKSGGTITLTDDSHYKT